MRNKVNYPSNDTQRIYFEVEQHHRSWDHFIVREFAQQRWRLLQNLLPANTIIDALDVGAGAGFSTAYTPKEFGRIWAGDQSLFMLNRHPFPKDRLIAFDALALPFPDGAFDLVYAWELLHHCSEPERIVCELSRVARRFLVLFEPNRYNPAQAMFALYDREHRWVLKYSLAYMIQLARHAGLNILHSGTGGWIFPNRTPEWVIGALRLLPYRLPGLGISNYVICSKTQ